MTIAKTTNICPTRSFVGVKRFSRRGTGSPRRPKFSRKEKITYDGYDARRRMSAQSAHFAHQFKVGSPAFWSEQTPEFSPSRRQLAAGLKRARCRPFWAPSLKPERSAERRVGKECVSTCRYRGA